MKENIKLFDMSDLSDIPEDFKLEIIQRKITDFEMVLDLFSIKKELTTPEVILGIYRKYGKNYKMQRTSTLLSKLKVLGKLRRVKKSRYIVVEK